MFIRSQIQILIRHNFFHIEYFLLKFSGSLELFLKRSIPVRFCSTFMYLVTRNFRNVRKFSKYIAKNSDRFEIMDESEVSRIVVLQNKKRFTERYLSAYA